MERTSVARLQRSLLKWFDKHARKLPWRATRDPYAIWVSEVMLQQTQVATVIPYFEHFLQVFPDVRALAQASLEDVLRLWEGLGYYRRARALHQAARTIVAEHGGTLPRDAATLGRLPGLGRYTVNAVLSQANDMRLPILEGNSQRVLCRLLGIEEDPRIGPVRKRLWQTAESLLPRRRVGQFNQALMELGALLCTPTRPACASCPITDHCAAFRNDRQECIPRKPSAPRIEKVDEVAVVVRRRRQVLIVRRADSGRWAGLWEFPHLHLEESESHADAARRLLESVDIDAELGSEIVTLRHSITRFRVTLVLLEARYRGGTFRSSTHEEARWVSPARLGDYPFSSPQRRLAARIVG